MVKSSPAEWFEEELDHLFDSDPYGLLQTWASAHPAPSWHPPTSAGLYTCMNRARKGNVLDQRTMHDLYTLYVANKLSASDRRRN